MTKDEINKAIDQLRECVDLPYGNDISGSTAETAIKALEEIQMYRDGKLSLVPTDSFKKQREELDAYKEIGTVEECREAVEKTIAKKPDLEGDGYADGELVYDTWYCPNCGQWYETDYDDYKCCPECGQKIDWSYQRLESEE